MKLTIETANNNEVELILQLFKKYELGEINLTDSPNNNLPIVRGDKTENPRALFGIWKDNPRSLEKIRDSSWTRNWNL